MSVLDPSKAPVGVALAGGQSRRMGCDKALLRLDGPATLLERTVAILRAAGLDEIALSVSTPDRADVLRQAVPALAGLRVVVDAQQGCGPLAGLGAALSACPGRHVLLVACDLPGLNPVALRLVARAAAGADIVVPLIAGRDQPLHACYGPACLPVVARLLAEGRLALRQLLATPELRVHRLDEQALARYHVSVTAFDNLNTPADLVALQDSDG